MRRRDFVRMGVLSSPGMMLAQTVQGGQTGKPGLDGAVVKAEHDRLGEAHTLGFSKIQFKTTGDETGGLLFVLEHQNLLKGGPFRHLHPDQDEWMYAMAGEYRVEIGDKKLTLGPGDSVLMPRKVPHVWAQVGETPGKLLVAFTPAGNMEAFFRDFGKAGKMPTEAAAVLPYGLVRTGPPLTI